MAGFDVRPLDSSDADWVRHFIAGRWGAEFLVAHGTTIYPHELPGFVAILGGEKVGLITYSISGGSCEIVSLDSLRPSIGFGTALIEAVKAIAQQSRCSRVWLITTNDNLNALRFYQKRGFVLAAIHPNALEMTRRIKPVPLIGEFGIPLRDEIELELILKDSI